MKKNSVLVIGGTGFIGEYFVRGLVVHGYKDIAVLHKDYYKGGLPLVHYFRCDDAKYLLKSIVQKSEKIVFMTQPNEGLLREILGVIPKNIQKTFLYTSTTMVYRGGKVASKEKDDIFPITWYAKQKHHEEEILQSFALSHKNVKVIIARLGNVYGDKKNHGMITLAFRTLDDSLGKKKNELIIAGDGKQLRDFVFVDDVAKALVLLLTNKTVKAGPVNVTTGIGHTLLEVVAKIEEVTKKKVKYRLGPPIDETYAVIGDTTRLESMIGWHPDTDLSQGLQLTCERLIVLDTLK